MRLQRLALALRHPSNATPEHLLHHLLSVVQLMYFAPVVENDVNDRLYGVDSSAEKKRRLIELASSYITTTTTTISNSVINTVEIKLGLLFYNMAVI